jgi:hypothetical protein
MITSIFRKSKPINFFIVFAVSLFAFIAAINKYGKLDLNALEATKLTTVFLCCFLSVLLVDFIVSKNSLSRKGNAEVLLISSFLLTIPQVFLSWEVVFSNLLVLLALRRIISLRTPKEHLKKLFDAGFLIGLASLFYFWSLLFFILIFVALLFYAESEFKKWLTPFLGLLAVVMVSVGFSLIYNDTFFTILNLNSAVSFNFNAYNTIQFIIAITVLFSFGLWSSFFYLKVIKKKIKSFRPSYKVVVVACLIAVILLVIAPTKNGSEFLFLFAPLSIIISNYIETIEEKWFKELFVLMLMLIPVVLLML